MDTTGDEHEDGSGVEKWINGHLEGCYLYKYLYSRFSEPGEFPAICFYIIYRASI